MKLLSVINKQGSLGRVEAGASQTIVTLHSCFVLVFLPSYVYNADLNISRRHADYASQLMKQWSPFFFFEQLEFLFLYKDHFRVCQL